MSLRDSNINYLKSSITNLMAGVPMTEQSSVSDMGPGRDDPEGKYAVAARLRLLVTALKDLGKIKSASDLCAQAGIDRNSWSNATGTNPLNRLSVESAAKLYRTFRISVNYTFLGLKDDLPAEIRRKIASLEGH